MHMQLNPDAELNPGNEAELFRIKKHPFGVWIVYITAGFAYIVGVLSLLFLLPLSGLSVTSSQLGMIWALYGLAGIAIIGFLLMYRYIYWASELVVTHSAVTQNLQVGLFSRKVSRLDMEKVEDVTATQHGIFQRIFGFGTLIVETAGEQDHFIFPNCPNPNEASQKIHHARQDYNDRVVEAVQRSNIAPMAGRLAEAAWTQAAPAAPSTAEPAQTPPVQAESQPEQQPQQPSTEN